MIRGSSLFFCVLLSSSIFAQLDQTARYEVLLEASSQSFDVIPGEENGLLIWRSLRTPSLDHNVLDITILDTLLNVKLQKQFLINSKLNFIASKYNGGNAFLLYGDYLNNKRNLRIFQISLYSGEAREHVIQNIIPFSFYDMQFTNNAVIIGGYYNYRPLVIQFNFEERIPRILPGLFNSKAELAQMKVNTSGNIDIVLATKNVDNVNTLFVHTFSEEAQLIRVIELEATKKKALLFGRTEPLRNQAQLVAGVYGRRNSEYSRGIFIANINQFGEQNIKYYNYAEFENFFSYMRAKREQRIKRRIERKKIKNKKIKFNYRLLVHQIFDHNNQFILLGEAFYPKYRNVQSQPGVFNPVWSVNRGYFSYDRIFEGYQYTHAVVIGFNRKGEVLWDNSFEIKDILSQRLNQFTHASFGDDKINLFYVYDNKIRSKVISGNDVLEGKEAIDIKLKNENDEVGQNDTNLYGMKRWYGDTYLTYGEQTVKNLQSQNIALNRHVFFINKVVPE